MSLNSGRISQAITGQALNPQYYYNTEERNIIDYDLIADKFASAVREKLKGMGIYADKDKLAEVVMPGVSQRLYLYNKRGTT